MCVCVREREREFSSCFAPRERCLYVRVEAKRIS